MLFQCNFPDTVIMGLSALHIYLFLSYKENLHNADRQAI